ncbi:aconitate hydratase [Fimbriimonas ginsengisoli]|uniref:Aconitate hydratase A n=1 Tax=Fimbriimonas ginsengisoli Gsoil 348 TaxID=661478 RepID=A0A068NTI7_FIMGI|nr:aconitate hydratase [Fimbriimonas ginsengisoli]AIE84929.1 aconitate hydratase 1 [Fimbriimonas ginsengisoli Gsoil 348]
MNSFGAQATFASGGSEYTIYRLDALKAKGHDIGKLPYSLRILLENLLRTEDNRSVFAADIEALATWNPKAEPTKEISFTPARVILQDFTGVPCVVDLAAMRDAMTNLAGDPKRINPLQPVELVIDHSVQTDAFGRDDALTINRDLEYERNRERYEFLKWGQLALDNFRVVPPNTGIVHQVNLEHLARVAFVRPDNTLYPDTLVGTDSHTTMVNGLGVLGWGVGGIEAEAAMLGQPVSMLIPQVIGFRLLGKLPEGATATDLVLTVTEMLRKKGVVGKFVEFFGEGLQHLPLADRATIGNMSPEFGATCAIFPVDDEVLRYMRLTGRPEKQVDLVEAYFKEQGLFYTPGSAEASYSDVLELNLTSVQPSIAGPKRPQDRLLLGDAKASFAKVFADQIQPPKEPSLIGKLLGQKSPEPVAAGVSGVGTPSSGSHSGSISTLENPSNTVDLGDRPIQHGDVVIASITSCTNTSNPSVMLAAGLLAKKAVEKGLMSKPWVKTSLAPGSRVVTDMYERSGLMPYLKQLKFHPVGYGCMTCIGNSGPLPDEVSRQINENNLVACSVLSGNRNFEGRINQDIKANYLMSPPLVVAYAIAGSMNVDLATDPLGNDQEGNPVYLKDIWPSQAEIADAALASVNRQVFQENYADVFKGDERWAQIQVTGSDTFVWHGDSTYIKNPPYFEGMSRSAPTAVNELSGMKVLAKLGDSITTDHISPAGSIKLNSPAGSYLTQHGVSPQMFNSYGSRRGNHEVMVRGTFANVRLRNQIAPGTEGGYTTYWPTGEVTTIYDASVLYQAEGTPLLVIAGKEYGSGSSRDWAAKGTFMLGIKAVLAQSFERIHRSNLIGMGVVPLEFVDSQSADSLGLSGSESYDLVGLADAIATNFAKGKLLAMRATDANGKTTEFKVRVRIDTPQENLYYLNGGILQYVLRQLVNG